MEKQIKVLFLLGGLPHYFRFLLERMNQAEDIDVMLALPRARGAFLDAAVHENRDEASFRRFELEEHRAWYGKAALRGLPELLRRERPDIVVVGWPYVLQFYFNPALPRLLRKQDIRFIYRDIPFNMPPYGKTVEYFRKQRIRNEAGDAGVRKGVAGYLSAVTLTRIRKRYLHMADALIFYADSAYELMETYGVPRKRIFITANSPDTDRLLATYEKVRQLPPLLPPNPHRLIHVGRLVKWKRVDLLLNAVKLLEKDYPGVELLIIGYGPEEDNLKRQAADLDLGDRVTFTGGVYEEEKLGRYLHASTVYVLAGMGGLSINDAMCFGKPVICSEADGTEKRLVREDVNGKYFENGNAADLAGKIAFFLDDPPRAERFGENSLKIIREEVNIHTVIAAFREAFRFATDHPRRAK